MTEAQIMEEIQRLTADYIQHTRYTLFTFEHQKYWDVYDMYTAKTPQQIMNHLCQKHQFGFYGLKLKHEVLVMNRTP